MTQTPSDDALLAATIDYLEAQLLPVLEGEHRFKTRLAVNALKVLGRGQQARAGGGGPMVIDFSSDTSSESSSEVRQNPSEVLAHKVRHREVALYDVAVLAQIEQWLQKSLAVNNPKWIDN